MSWWTSFVDLAFKANKAHKGALASQEDSEKRLIELSTEFGQLSKEEEGLSLQIADLRKPRESGPVHTRRGAYNKYLKGRRREPV